MAFKRINQSSYEKISREPHKDYAVVETRVSDYLRKFGTGHADPSRMPQDNRPEVNDPRTEDEMLQDGFEPGLGTDELDVLMELDRRKEDFAKMVETIKMSKSDREKFDNAMSVIQDNNASYQQKTDAARILDELEEKGKISRARN